MLYSDMESALKTAEKEIDRLTAELAEARELLREWFKNMDPPARIDDRVRAAIDAGKNDAGTSVRPADLGE